MKAILIFRTLAKKEISHIEDLSRREEIAIFSAVEVGMKIGNCQIELLEIPIETKRYINYEILDKLLGFGDKEVADKSITKHFAIDKIASIWYYHKFRIYFLLRNKHYQIALFEMLQDKYQEVEVYSQFSFSRYIDHPSARFFLPSNKSKTNYFSILRFILFFVLRVISGFFKSLHKSNTEHLAIDKGELQPVIMPDLKMRNGNYNLEYLYAKFDKRFAILHEVEIPKFNGESGFKTNWNLFENRNRQAKQFIGEYNLFRGMISSGIRKQHRLANQKLYGVYALLKSELNDPFEWDVINEYEKLQKSSSLYILKYYSYRQFFANQSFKTVTTIDENSPSAKTILDAAKAHGIKTIGIQHGNIHDLHPAYVFSKKDHECDPMPDLSLIWGDYYKSFLTKKGNYAENRLSVTGQIRTDIIPVLLQSEFSIFQKDKKNIVFASQPQRDPNLRYKAAEDVFVAIAHLGPPYFLYLKLHPAESNDQNYYREIASKAGCENYEIVGNEDLYKVIASSDLMITCFSTVGAETVYFKKPLIIMDHLKQDIQNYYKDGIAFQATNAVELKQFISGIAEGKLKIDEAAYKRFIARYAYRIDGNVVERILNCITGSCE